ncbi:hypothetical protein CEXT_166741 [Caerostris extrusa]|uniref:Uncharacterized protein n=1 Tax=Caerostris extrusa TaxID=172846 RepID=A0AAV4XZ29_CAEEX|nr:hypothetical protein CEXT_166741 [Caerostris extrusa]
MSLFPDRAGEWTSGKVFCRRFRVHKFQKGWPQPGGNESAGDELTAQRPGAAPGIRHLGTRKKKKSTLGTYELYYQRFHYY